MDPSAVSADDLRFSTQIDETLVRGAIALEPGEHGVLPHRLPAWARRQAADPRLSMAESQPSGVRLVFRSTATTIELDTVRTKVDYRGAPPRPDGVYELLIDGELTDRAEANGGNTVIIDMMTGAAETVAGPVGTISFSGLPAKEKTVEIWLPFNETTELLTLRTDAPIEIAPTPTRRVWLHHGSSISHGSNAAGPTSIWPVLAASTAEVDLINLGFSGSALLDPFTARTMRDTPADLISVKIGINIVGGDLMRRRAFGAAVHGFLDTIREGHPDTPLLVVSAIYCPIHEDTPGPGVPDFADGQVQFVASGDPAERAAGKLTLNVTRDELARIVDERSADDPNLFYLDGRDLYGAGDFDELPLPDQLHPDAATHRRIGRRFAETVFGPDGAFKGGR